MTHSATSYDVNQVLRDLTEIVGADNVTNEDCDLVCYEADFAIKSASGARVPDLAVQPETADQVVAIAKVANTYGMPLVPRGGGTGMWGGAVPVGGGIVLDMRRMDRIVDVDEERRAVTVQAGVSVRDLAVCLEKRGYFVADRPESWFAATVGARTQTSGTGYYYNARYGRAIDQVLSLEVVLPTGEVIRTGTAKAYDPASGYDLTRLFSSAEGTLGIVTEVTLRLHRTPEHRIVSISEFPTFEDTISAVMAIRDSGLVPETIETMDGEAYLSHCGAPTGEASRNGGAMVVGHAGAAKVTEAQAELTREICERQGGTPAPKRCAAAWTAYKETYPVNPFPLHTSWKGKPVKYVLDVTVPLAGTAAVVRAYRELADRYGIESHGAVVSHCAPDFHSVVAARAFVEERDERDVEAVRNMEKEIYACVRRHGGGMGGSGGVGAARLRHAEEEQAPAVDLMARLKRLVDPNDIMNPGKKPRGL